MIEKRLRNNEKQCQVRKKKSIYDEKNRYLNQSESKVIEHD